MFLMFPRFPYAHKFEHSAAVRSFVLFAQHVFEPGVAAGLNHAKIGVATSPCPWAKFVDRLAVTMAPTCIFRIISFSLQGLRRLLEGGRIVSVPVSSSSCNLEVLLEIGRLTARDRDSSFLPVRVAMPSVCSPPRTATAWLLSGHSGRRARFSK